MHTIRLKGFWETSVTEEGRFRHSRRFGKPTNLDEDEHVWLFGDRREEADQLFLNGECLGSLSLFAFDITSKLEHRNDLVIVTASDDPPEEVRLEIRRD